MQLSQMFDSFELFDLRGKFDILSEMIAYPELVPFVHDELNGLKRSLLNEQKYDELQMLKESLHFIGIDFEYHRPAGTSFYRNSQNVHMIEQSTLDVARKLVDSKLVDTTNCSYFRPVEFGDCKYDHFFAMIENGPSYDLGIDSKLLFACVWMHVRDNDLMVERLKEEIIDSNDTCMSGCIGRMINALRGFDSDFETTMSDYEYERGRIYHRLSLLLKNTDPDEMVANIRKFVDEGSIEISGENGFKILSEYTGTEWTDAARADAARADAARADAM